MSQSLHTILAAAVLAAGCVSAVSKSPAVTRNDAESAAMEDGGADAARTDAPPGDAPAPGDGAPDAPGDRPEAAPPSDADRARLPVGQPCTLDDECGSSHCVGRVCCTTTCPAGAPPCGQDGTCDGNGRCRSPGTDVACGEDKCAAGTFTPAPLCDGAGKCGTAAPVTCASSACQGSRCAGSCGPGAPCPDGLYCAANGQCQPKKAGGARCDGDGECTTGHCAEHVCCDTGCGGACQSCLAQHTGAADGKCAPVRAGADPYDSCQAALPTGCLNDGACDGKGGCQQHASGTPCRTEACVDGAGGSTYTPGGSCNGSGRCVDAGNGKMCDPYVCGGSKCKASCTARADCKTGYYCASPSCTVQKALGTICSGPDECSSGLCGGFEAGAHNGRCCQTCQCPQPTGGNLLVQPGIDQDPGFGPNSPWKRYLTSTPSGNADIRWTSSYDRDGCPYSGALDIVLGDQRNGVAFQCLSATAGETYYYGGAFRAPSVPETLPNGEPWQATCGVAFYTSLGSCNDTVNRFDFRVEPSGVYHVAQLHQLYSTPNQWISFSGLATAPPGTRAIALECEGLDDGAPTTELLFDKLFLSTTVARY